MTTDTWTCADRAYRKEGDEMGTKSETTNPAEATKTATPDEGTCIGCGSRGSGYGYCYSCQKKLEAKLSEAKARRCPADGMSDEQVGYELLVKSAPAIIWSQRANTETGARARELFTPKVEPTANAANTCNLHQDCASADEAVREVLGHDKALHCRDQKCIKGDCAKVNMR